MRNQLYYAVKPYVPWRLRLAARRVHARLLRRSNRQVWPILESAGDPPPGWPGWPEGKKFAVVLTHDVESARGYARVRAMAELELSLGFRSSYNFVPEGDYTVEPELVQWLLANGFEVGVHDLHHDGKLYDSRAGFLEKAARINRHLKSWKATGFRSAFMLRRLDWLDQLDISYDASTFDTDPFEPQPNGVGTIFPFWIEGRNGRRGFAELPYTCPQDSTLFNVFREQGPITWRQKLEWIAERGGMVLLNVHPDYAFLGNGGERRADEYPITYYSDFLQSVKTNHTSQYWHALPRDVSNLVEKHKESLPSPVPIHSPSPSPSPAPVRSGRKIWIDLDNTPHVPFFLPIIRELRNRGHDVVLTARVAFQVCELADRAGLEYRRVGHHYGKHMVMKAFGLVWRCLQLLPFVLKERPDLALSHGARSQVLLGNILRVPTIIILDYEHAHSPIGCRPRWKIVPEVVSAAAAHLQNDHVRTYRGIKEDVYAPDFRPDPSLLGQLGIDPNARVVTVRPPAVEAHYHNPESEALFAEVMQYLHEAPDLRTVLLPRNKAQAEAIRARFPKYFENGKTIIPSGAVDGLNLVWYSDLVVSGGGTMNREAAALGVPVYSIFRGPTGAVDRHLQEEGRLLLIQSVSEVRSRIRLDRRDKSWREDRQRPPALHDVVSHVESILALESKAKR